MARMQGGVKGGIAYANGGDGEIRTRGSDYSLRRFSKPLVSATHPRLLNQCGGKPRAIAREYGSINYGFAFDVDFGFGQMFQHFARLAQNRLASSR